MSVPIKRWRVVTSTLTSNVGYKQIVVFSANVTTSMLDAIEYVECIWNHFDIQLFQTDNA